MITYLPASRKKITQVRYAHMMSGVVRGGKEQIDGKKSNVTHKMTKTQVR